MASLLTQQIENYDIKSLVQTINERGYTTVPGLISTQVADEARGLVEGYLEAEATDATRQAKTQRVGRLAVRHPLFRDLMCHPVVLAVWERFLAEDCFCGTWSANTAYPGFNAFGWHIDYPYWSIKQPWPEGNLTGQTLWLLDDLTPENGATGVIPYSHKLGCPPVSPTDVWREDGELLTGKRGDVVFGHGAWYHTARPNTTSNPRTVLLGMYMRPCLIPQEDMQGQLAQIKTPSEIVTKVMGGKQHRPRNVGV
jgi:hypothetical protein